MIELKAVGAFKGVRKFRKHPQHLVDVVIFLVDIYF